MRSLIRVVSVSLLVLSCLAASAKRVSAADLDTTADRVFGQPDFTSNTQNNGGVTSHSLYYPTNMVLDLQGNLYIADTYNNRVLEYNNPLETDMVADRVFGQPNFTSSLANNGGISAHSLKSPFSVALDAQGNLFVADTYNNRVLEYNTPLTTDTIADRVFGQPDFTSNTINNGGVRAKSLNIPYGIALDAEGNLYVADTFNHRVLEYNTPLAGNTSADMVFGQPDFISNTFNNGGVSAQSLYQPYSVVLDIQGDLYVADAGNNRVLEYDNPQTSDVIADLVFGQPDFTSNGMNTGGISAKSLNYPTCVVLDAQDNLYLVDLANARVLEYNKPLTTNTTADRVFGQPDFTSSMVNNGGINSHSLNNPLGLALDARGNLFVADELNSRVLEFDLPIAHGVPLLTDLNPNLVPAGNPGFTLTVDGSGFVLGSSVRWNGVDRPTTYLSSTQLNASVSAADVASGGPFAVTVFTPAPGGGTSTLINFHLYIRSGKDNIADEVLGQPNFVTDLPNNPLLAGGANRLHFPGGSAVDPGSGRLFFADSFNNRVLSWPNALALANGQAADLVIGQPNFTYTTANSGGISAYSQYDPFGIAVDANGNLYVGDVHNYRVLVYKAPLTNGMAASLVFGQGGSFTTGVLNNGGVSANSLSISFGLAVDAQGNLYIADTGNNRVLEFDTPLTTDTTADRVFGQPGFITNDINHGGVSAHSLYDALGIAMDALGNLYLADNGNNRVLEYDTPLTTDTNADRVFGQPDFISITPNHGGISAHSLQSPFGVALNLEGNLLVTDAGNNRVLGYKNPLTTNNVADRVFGQPNFISNLANNGGISAVSLNHPESVIVDGRYNLYIVDSFNNRVLEYDPNLLKIFEPLVMR